MDLGIEGRVALVTGAGGGIGSAIATALALEGCQLVLLDACESSLHDVVTLVAARQCTALPVVADVRSYDGALRVMDQVTAQFGGLDIVVCCAGITRDAVSWKLPESAWDDVLAVNLKGCFNYAHAAVPVLRRRGGGRIVNITSINGLRGKFGQANYAASKAGVIGLTKTLARELGRFSITVNAIAPGMVATAMTGSLGTDAIGAAMQETVLGELCTRESVADAVLFLTSGRARHITGEVLRVDAGQYI